MPIYNQVGRLSVSCSPEAVKSRARRFCAQVIFDISLTDRYWEVLIRIDEGSIKHEEADYRFGIDDPDREVEIGLKEVYMIM